MAIDFTGVTKVIQLDTYNNPETQTEIKRVYLGEALQWQKPQSQYVWQCVHTGMSQPWTLNDLVVLVRFVRTGTNANSFDINNTYTTERFGIVHAYPDVTPIAGHLDTTENGNITLYHDSVLGWCLSDDILPNQVSIVVKTSGKYAQIRNNYSYLGTPNPTKTEAGYDHYLNYTTSNNRIWWSAGTLSTLSSSYPNIIFFSRPHCIYGTLDAPVTTNVRWRLKGTGTVNKKTVWVPTSQELTAEEPTAQWAFFKRVRNANNE